MRGLGAAELNLFDLFAKISLDTSEYDSGVKDVTKSGSSLASKLKSGLASAGKAAAVGIGAITTAAGAAVGGLLALEGATEEYRIAQGKLNTAFEAAGYSTETAQEAYRGFYEILGDTDTATEASQLLAKLAQSEEDVSKWTEIAAGVSGTFGDSLPIEGLIEASNETAKVGTVTGVLADALNWAGISEDEFNSKLAAAGSESERNQLIMETLAGTYDEASDAFYRNNESIVAARDSQIMMDQALSTLGQTVSDVKNRLMSEFVPALANVATAFSGMLSGTEGADKQFATAVGELVNTAVSKLPEFLSMGVQIITALASGIVQSIPTVIAAIPQVVSEIGTALSELLPQILDMGVQLLDQLVTGIETGLPDMIERIPQVIDGFLNFITEHLPDVLNKGVEIINSLVDGIIEAIPVFVSNLPQIITSFANFIAENLPKIAEAGISIIVNLVSGIISAIPQVVDSLPQIISAIVDGIGALMDSVIEIGADIVRGIWDGIKSMAGWIGDKVAGFFGGIVDGVKDFLGIHSPSTVFKAIGKYMMDGLEIGLTNSAGEVMETVGDIVDEIKNRFSTVSDIFDTRQDISDLEYQLWESGAGKNATEAEKYAKKLELLRKQEKDQKNVVEAAVSAYKSIVGQYGENSQESLKYKKTLLEEQLQYQDLKNSITETIGAMMDLREQQAEMSNISFADSGLGIATRATINATVDAVQKSGLSGGTTSFNLVLPAGERLASYVFSPMVDYAKANGTPILNPT